MSEKISQKERFRIKIDSRERLNAELQTEFDKYHANILHIKGITELCALKVELRTQEEDSSENPEENLQMLDYYHGSLEQYFLKNQEMKFTIDSHMKPTAKLLKNECHNFQSE